MNLQRKLSLVVATGAIALGAGHFVQNKASVRAGLEGPPVVVTSVVPVAAGPAVSDDAPLPFRAQAVTDVGAEAPSAVPDLSEDPVFAKNETTLPLADDALVSAEPDCRISFDLIPQPGAMIGITLLAPCNPDQRVVLQHAGLAVTGRTSASGALFAVLPALTQRAEIEAIFSAGERQSASLVVNDFAGIKRFAVQWQDKDAFQLHGFENGAGYDEPGHISAGFTGTLGETGVLTLLGDATVPLPLLAEVFTFGPAAKADVVLEAAVTEGTCGREILGETILSKDGTVTVTDLTVAMPTCDAVGDILVLKNLLQDMTLAAAN
jgi:hypothetical protein